MHGPFNNYQSHVRVAAGPSQALITWVSGNASNLTRRIVAKRILPDGTFLDANPIAPQPGVAGEQFRPAAAWDGARYVVAFGDLRASTSLLDKISDVFATRVGVDGAVLDPSGFALEVGPGSAVAPSAFALAPGRTLLATSVFRAEPPFCAYRLATRVVDANTSAPLAYCFGDGSGAACPCGTPGPAGRGCPTSVGPGARLRAIGDASVAADTLKLWVTDAPEGLNVLFFQGSTQVAAGAGSVFGEGLRCAGGTLIRLGQKTQSFNWAAYPGVGDAPISQRGFVAPGDTRHYQVWFQDSPGLCGPPVANLSNGYTITWH